MVRLPYQICIFREQLPPEYVADTKTAPEEEFLQCHLWTVLTSMVHALKTGVTLLSHNDNIFKLGTIITIFCKN
jgi:hypothetical protein